MTNNDAPAREGGYHTTPERLFSDSVRAGIDVAWHLTSTPLTLLPILFQQSSAGVLVLVSRLRSICSLASI